MSCFQVRTDLALEAREGITDADGELRGVRVEEYRNEKSEVSITKVIIDTRNGARAMGKPMGTYITLEAPGLNEPDEDYHREVSEELAKQIKKLGEETKVAIRNIRRDMSDDLKKIEKDEKLPEDSVKDNQDKIQKLTDKYTGIVDKTVAEKEKEVMTV